MIHWDYQVVAPGGDHTTNHAKPRFSCCSLSHS